MSAELFTESKYASENAITAATEAILPELQGVTQHVELVEMKMDGAETQMVHPGEAPIYPMPGSSSGEFAMKHSYLLSWRTNYI